MQLEPHAAQCWPRHLPPQSPFDQGTRSRASENLSASFHVCAAPSTAGPHPCRASRHHKNIKKQLLSQEGRAASALEGEGLLEGSSKMGGGGGAKAFSPIPLTAEAAAESTERLFHSARTVPWITLPGQRGPPTRPCGPLASSGLPREQWTWGENGSKWHPSMPKVADPLGSPGTGQRNKWQTRWL